jgi:UDP-N-acetylmuramyl pentapeptide phosphotransferase/UDP-N-acetylglucosamine-1-phosphate transferase
MIFFLGFLFIIVLSTILLIFCRKYNFLLNFSGEKHQVYTSSKNIPLIGGTVSLAFVLIFSNFELETKFFILSIYILGFLSDIKLIKLPIKRLLAQFIIVLFFLYIQNINLVSTNFKLLDFALKNIFVSFLFTSFCLLILINGTNFIDGININVLGYYLIISFILLMLKKKGFHGIDETEIFLLTELIFILFIFNILNKIYLGDGGSFVFGSIFGLILIKFYLDNINFLSSFYIVLILWYPAFENFFSIIRKFCLSKNPTEPDNSHLHHLLFFFFRKKLKWNKSLVNNFTGLIINLFNFIVIFLGTLNPNNVEFLILIIFLNIFTYIIIYFWLLKINNKFK